MNRIIPQSKSDATGEPPAPAREARQPRAVSPLRRAWRKVDRGLVLIHRWLGIGTCILSAIWCLSGIAIMYVVQPKLTEIEHYAGLQPIRWDQVRIDPDAALKAAGQARFPQELALEMQGTGAVYLITDWKGAAKTVSATDGRPITRVSAAEALAIAHGFAGSDKPTLIGKLDSDRWTFKAPFDKTRPFYLVALNDPAGRQLHISARTGAVAMESSRFDRAIMWVGRIPHIFETAWMRPHPTAYRQIMLWTTGLATITALGGLVLGFIRLSLIKRYGGGRITPFRGWMEWHHILGVIGGVTLFVWIGTSYIYMKPNHIYEERGLAAADRQRYGGHARADFPLTAADIARLAPAGAAAAGMTWLDGKPLVHFNDAANHFTTFDGGAGAPARLSDTRLLQAARLLVPDAPVQAHEYRATTDRYWHTFKGNYRKLPVFRVKFGDRRHTWVHLDPTTGKVTGEMTDSDRGYFLFFNEIHKVDLYGVPEPIRKPVLWILMLAGAAISLTGAVVGWKHLTR